MFSINVQLGYMLTRQKNKKQKKSTKTYSTYTSVVLRAVGFVWSGHPTGLKYGDKEA